MSENTNNIAPGSMPSIIFRRSPPGQYDHAPQGTLCVVSVKCEDKESEGCTHEHTYKQNSKDESVPVWEKM